MAIKGFFPLSFLRMDRLGRQWAGLSVPLVLMSVQWSHGDLALGWGGKGMAFYATSIRRQGLSDVFLHLILGATLRSRSDCPHYIDEAQRD